MPTCITPTLFIGDPPNFDVAREVRTVEEAVEVIEAGLVAVLPEGALEEARQVVARVGRNSPLALRRIAELA